MIDKLFKPKAIMLALIISGLSAGALAQTPQIPKRFDVSAASQTVSMSDWFHSIYSDTSMSFFAESFSSVDNLKNNTVSDILHITADSFSSFASSLTASHQAVVVDGGGKPFSIATNDIASVAAKVNVIAFENGETSFTGKPQRLESIKPVIYVENPSPDTASMIAAHVSSAFVNITSGSVAEGIRTGWGMRSPTLEANQRIGLSMGKNANELIPNLFSGAAAAFHFESFGFFASTTQISTENIGRFAHDITATHTFAFAAFMLSNADLDIFGRSSSLAPNIIMSSKTHFAANAEALSLINNSSLHSLTFNGIDPTSVMSQINNKDLHFAVLGIPKFNVKDAASLIQNGRMASFAMPSAGLQRGLDAIRSISGVALGRIDRSQGSFLFMTSTNRMNKMLQGAAVESHQFSTRAEAEKMMLRGNTGMSSTTMMFIRNQTPNENRVDLINNPNMEINGDRTRPHY